jgi:hypothetical protein
MAKTKDSIRENFEVSPEQRAAIESLQELVNAPNKKELILLAINVLSHLANETQNGNCLFVGRPGEGLTRLLIPGIEKPKSKKWMFLVEHDHPWRRQLYVKGRKLQASAVWSGIKTNNLSEEDAADNWDLPVEAIREILEYCEANQALLKMEAAEELRLLGEKGVDVAVPAACR